MDSKSIHAHRTDGGAQWPLSCLSLCWVCKLQPEGWRGWLPEAASEPTREGSDQPLCCYHGSLPRMFVCSVRMIEVYRSPHCVLSLAHHRCSSATFRPGNSTTVRWDPQYRSHNRRRPRSAFREGRAALCSGGVFTNFFACLKDLTTLPSRGWLRS